MVNVERSVRAVVLVVLLIFLPSAWAGDAPLPPCEQVPLSTTADPEVPLEQLKLQLVPLTRCELQAEADAWLTLVKAKATEIANAEIAFKFEKAKLTKAKEAQEALEEVQSTIDEGDVKEQQEAAAHAREALQELEQVKELAERDSAVTAAAESAVEKKEEAPVAAKGDETAPAPVAEEENVFDAELQEAKERKSDMLVGLTRLREERTVLIDHLDAVLTAWAAKGGDDGEYRRYITAVSGIKVDISDAEATWTAVLGWLESKEGGIRWLLNVVKFVLTLVVFWFLAKIVERLVRRVVKSASELPQLMRDFITSSARRVVVFIGLLVALAMLEVEIGPVLALIGAAGFVVAFALQNSLGNFASGILILIYRPFDVGDFVEVGGVVGAVESLNLLSIKLKTPDNKTVILSNNTVWGGQIANFTRVDKRRVDMVFGISYGDDIAKAQSVLEDIIAAHELVLEEPAPVIRLHELGESSVNFIVRPWVRPADYWTVHWDVTRAVKERFDKEGISIPFPQRDVHLYQVAKS